MFVIENVPDLVRHRNGRTLAGVIGQLERPTSRLRYSIEYRIYDAALFGTPQSRRRILIFGVRHGAAKHRLPPAGPDLAPLFAAIRHGKSAPKALEPYLQLLQNAGNDQIVSAKQALSDIPLLKAAEPERGRHYARKAHTAFQRWVRINAPPVLSNTQTPDVNLDTFCRLLHIPPGGSASTLPRGLLNGLSRRHMSAYRRLHPDAPSTALSTRYDCVYHYAQERSLSVREYARLQSIPDRIAFPSEIVSRRAAYEMIGNSVPPLLIERVLREVIEPGARSSGV
jgi:DNA (cytosine-5)-methyltransferase 1